MPGFIDLLRGRPIRLFESLANASQAGLNPLSLLETFSRDSGQKTRWALINMERRIGRGSSFSEAMRHQPGLFEPWQVEIVTLGETTGRLDWAFSIVAQILQDNRSLWLKLLSKMAYPAVLIHLAPFILNTPKLVHEGILPYLRPIAIYFLCLYLPLIALISLFKKNQEQLIKAQPFRRFAKAQFCLYLSALIQAGIDLFEAIRMASRAAGLQTQGNEPAPPHLSLTEILANLNIFSQSELAQIQVGELAGAADRILTQIAQDAKNGWM